MDWSDEQRLAWRMDQVAVDVFGTWIAWMTCGAESSGAPTMRLQNKKRWFHLRREEFFRREEAEETRGVNIKQKDTKE